jgi:hypothetical protein
MANWKPPDATPEVKSTTETPVEFLKSGNYTVIPITVSGAARDTNNSPTTILQAGLAMGKITASGKYAQYDDSASDGTEVLVGLLADQQDTQDETPADRDAICTLVIQGTVDASKVYGVDANGKADNQAIRYI